MFAVRWSFALFALVVLSIAVSRADEKKKEDEKKEHATARAVLAKAKIDLLKAIQTAQAKLPDGKPILANVEEEKGKQIFEIHMLVGDKVKEVEIDAVTGKVLEVEDDTDEPKAKFDEAKKVLAASKITFAKAIALAKAKVKNGKPFEVEFESENGKSIIEVELLSGNKVMEVEIDAITGQVLEVKEEKD